MGHRAVITDPSQGPHAHPTAGADNGSVKRLIAVTVLIVGLAGACGRQAESSGSPSAPTTPAAPAAPVVSVAPNPAVTTPDLSDVDKALASIDADIAAADRDPNNEGALQ